MSNLMLRPRFNALYRSSLAVVLSLVVSFSFAVEELDMVATSQASDVRVVIDISGSMKKSDPKNLRIPASELLIGLLPEGSQAGIWTFGKYVNMLVPHGTVNNQWKKKANKEIKKINSVAMYTNIGKAIERATDGWNKPDPTVRRNLILLTDGVVDISRNMADNFQERERITETLLPQLRQQGVTVHTIALSEQADAKLMQRLALETEGVFQTVINASDLAKAFLTTFDSAIPQDQVPLDDNYFSVDGSVDEFTALVFRGKNSPETLLQTPDGKKISQRSKSKSVKWLSAAGYDLITVTKPQNGEWRLIADEDLSNRVTIVSDLKLVVDEIPGNILLGERVGINIRLLEDGKLLSKNEFLNLVDIRVTQQHVGGRQWSAVLGGESHKGEAEPGRFFAKFGKTLVAGEHVFTIVADGKTFQRQSVQKVKVFEELVKVEVKLDETSPIAVFKVNVREDGGLLAADKTAMTLVLWDEDDQSQELDLEKNEIDHWLGKAAPFSGPGKYTYIVKVQGEAKSGRAVDYQTTVQELLYYPEGYEPEKNSSSLDSAADEVAQPEESAKDAFPVITKEEEKAAPEAQPAEEPKEKVSEEKPPEEVPAENPEASSETEVEAETPGFFEEIGTGLLVALLIGVNGLLIALGYGGYRILRKRKSKKDSESGEEQQKTSSDSHTATEKSDKPSSKKEKAEEGEAASLREIEEVDTKILGGVDLDSDGLEVDGFDIDDLDEDDELNDEILMDEDLESELEGLDDLDDQSDETDLESIDLDDSLLEPDEEESEDKDSPEDAESATSESSPDDGEDDITDLDEDFDLDIDIDELLNDNKD